jgi:hypothetical protein
MRASQTPSRTPYKRSSQNLSFPRTRVNKGMEKGRDRQEPRLFQLALDLSLCVSPSPPCIRQPHRL